MENSKQKSTKKASSKEVIMKRENVTNENSRRKNPKPKQPKMLVFQAIQKTFAVAGITRKLVTQAYPLNVKIVMGFLLLNTGATINLIYTVWYADTFAEYTQSIYVFSLVELLVFALLIVIFKVDELFKFVDTCNGIVNTSECHKTKIVWCGKLILLLL